MRLRGYCCLNLYTVLDFREFFQSLNAHNVRYLVVGGYAVAFHGHPRYTMRNS